MTKPIRVGILNYEVSGSGPIVVLLHGYLCSLRYWDTLRAELETSHTVIVIDLLGFGDSPKPKTLNYSYHDHISWLKRTLEHCGVGDQSVILGGHSMGALLALRYAAMYPQTVCKLMLLNIPLFKDAEEAHQELSGTNIFFRASLYWQLHR